MATPDSQQPMVLQPGQQPSAVSETQWWELLHQPSVQEANTACALHRRLEKLEAQALSSKTFPEGSRFGDNTSTSEMASQQQNYQANQGARYQGGQMPTQPAQGESSTRGGVGPDDAPRARTSTFGVPYRPAENGVERDLPAVPNQAQSLFAQHSGQPSTHSTTTQPGPSTVRPISNNHMTPLSSVIHNSTTAQSPSSASNRPVTSTKSPFTSPIECPPRNRANQILLINPTSTVALTNLLLYTIRPILPHGVEVTAYNAPYPAPTAIESAVDGVLSSETVLRDLAKYSTNNGETIQNYDALLVASYCDHPLIAALRESYDVPVIGILEASLYVSRMLSGRFGIMTTTTRTKLQIDDAVHSAGLSHFFIGAESLHLSPPELLDPSFISTPTSPDPRASAAASPTPSSRGRDELHKRIAVQARSLVAKGADTVILGSEFLSSNEAARIVKDAIREEDGRRTVNVIDAVEAGVMMANALVGMGVPTSKRGIFRSERETRRGRGQNWL